MDPAGFLGAFGLMVLLGSGTGFVTGLSPGIHVNNVAALLLATQAAWLAGLAALVPAAAQDPEGAGLLLACFLLATAASHAVCDFVPSVFFGAPTEETALATLPGHRLLLRGEGVRAVALAVRGAVLGMALSAALLVPLRLLLGDPVGLAAAFRPWSPFFLAGILAALLATEASRGRRAGRRVAAAAGVQALAGLLGLATLRGASPVDPTTVLFPLFSGLFGMPNLLLALRGRPGDIPDQRDHRLAPLSPDELRQAVRGSLAGAAVSWLPGLSGGAAATLASVGVRRRMSPAAFMVVLGAVSTSTTVLSVAVLFVIGRARSGAAAAVRDLVPAAGSWPAVLATPGALLWLLMASGLAVALAAPLTLAVARTIAPRWSRADPRKVSAVTLGALGVLLALATGPAGLLLAGLAALVGLVPIAARVRRVHLMASLLVPVLASYLAGA